jgi:hypothetical protein
MDKECKNCIHWWWDGGEDGRCKRYPPVILQNLIKDKTPMFEDDIASFCAYPVSVESDTCGEWSYDTR